MIEAGIGKDVESDLRIDPNNLSEEAAQQGAKYAYYAAVAEEAMADVERLKNEKELRIAELAKEMRAKLQAAGEKITEIRVEQMVKQDARYQRVQEALIEAQRKAGVLRAIEKAFSQRKDMIWVMAMLASREMNAKVAIERARLSERR